MNTDSWLAWLTGWIRKNPVKQPPAHLAAGYQQEVMARIRREAVREPVRWALPVPRWSFGLATAAACAALAVFLIGRPQVEIPIPGQIDQEWQLLAQLSDAPEVEADLEEELQLFDRIMLAEAVERPARIRSEVDQMLELLDRVDQDASAEADPSTDEELLNELERVDGEEIASS